MRELKSPFRPGFTGRDADDLARTLRALASATRVEIVALLAAADWQMPDEIRAHIRRSQSDTSVQLRVLEQAGLIVTEHDERKPGRTNRRSLDRDAFADLAALLRPRGAR